MKNFYSQHGEDYILNKIFEDQPSGVFIEIGCIDGKRFSNSLYFENLNWCGFCIEAHSGYINLLKKNRPKSKVIHCAVGEENCDEVIFYANKRGSLSTLNKSYENRWIKEFKNYFTGFEEQVVTLRTLTNICEEEKIIHIDFVSIDIEGDEYKVLMGINFSIIKPKVFVIECDTKEEEDKIDAILLNESYKKLLRIRTNLFYTLNMIDFKIKKNKFQLCHTLHPIDNGNDIVLEKEISIQSNSNFDKQGEPQYFVNLYS